MFTVLIVFIVMLVTSLALILSGCYPGISCIRYKYYEGTIFNKTIDNHLCSKCVEDKNKKDTSCDTYMYYTCYDLNVHLSDNDDNIIFKSEYNENYCRYKYNDNSNNLNKLRIKSHGYEIGESMKLYKDTYDVNNKCIEPQELEALFIAGIICLSIFVLFIIFICIGIYGNTDKQFDSDNYSSV